MASLRRHLFLGLPIVTIGLALLAVVPWFFFVCTVTDIQPGGPDVVDGSAPVASPSPSPDAGPVPRPCFPASHGVRQGVAYFLGALITCGFAILYICIVLVFDGLDDGEVNRAKKTALVVPIPDDDDDDTEDVPGN